MALADFLVRHNALLGRYAIPQLRPISRVIAICIYLLLVAPIILILVAMHVAGNLDLRALWRTLFVIFALFQFLLLGIVGAHLSGSAILQERTERSIDFFRLLPLSATSRIVGIVVGRNIVTLCLALCNTLFVAICGAAGGVSSRLTIEFLIFSWVSGVLAMLFALLVSTCAPRRLIPSSTTFVPLLGAALCLPFAIGFAVNRHEVYPHGAYVHFFGMEIRLFVFITCLALYAGFWFVLGLIRRFENERATFFSPAGSYANLAGAAVITGGLIWQYASENPRHALLIFWCSTAGVLLLALFGSCRTWDDYLEAQGRTGEGPGLRSVNRCNLAHGTGLVLIWGILATLIELHTGMVIPFGSVVICMTFCYVLLALWETSVTCAAWTTRIHLLTGFLAILYVILPAILGAITEAKDILALSPVGYITVLADGKYVPTMSPLFFNGGLLAILLLFVFRRYHSLAK